MPRLDSFITKSEKTSRNRALDPSRIYMAEVMDTRNITRGGEIKVWIMSSDIPREDESRWITASYASPFYGTSPYEPNQEVDFNNAPISFGSWFPMPFIGNKVFVFFPCVTGENVEPFWFSCPVNSMANSMLPGIPSQYFSQDGVPTSELNDKNAKYEYTQRNQTMAKREEGRAGYVPLIQAITKQGLKDDKLRGYSTAGSKRESPSMCYGILTPLGNSFTMDDGWSEGDNKQNWKMGSENRDLRNMEGLMPNQRLNEKRHNAGFRFRTRNGTQLLVSDEGNIYAINKDGTAWTEITDDGRLQGYAQTSADIACDGDINLYSKQKIRMEAQEGFVFKTPKTISIESGGDISIQTPHVKVSDNISSKSIYAKEGNIDALTSSKANMNGTFAGTLQGTAFYATNAGVIPLAQPDPGTKPAQVETPIIEPTQAIDSKIGEPSVNTIVSVLPSHEPYSGHNRNETFDELKVNSVPYSNERVSYNSAYVTNQVSPMTPIPPDPSKDKSIPKMDLTEHFTLADLCYSDTALRNGISNVPTDEEIGKLRLLAEKVLEPIWTNYGKRVIVNSGYRGPLLNNVIGGARTSQHCKGEAADIEIYGVSNYELASWIRDNLQFDQLILEYATNLSVDPNSGWVHVSFKDGSLRQQVLTINRYGSKSGLII